MESQHGAAYRVHLALSNLKSIDDDQLSSEDREKIAEAVGSLEEVGIVEIR
ncbi:hypothetical protein [Saliphagus infecundisoli]|uniref:FDX-ACB domain-containing protein n=1 Tax=Saliphagus infecundisoli TaxID=1849069 RepID=A0ABD5QJ08_9EURY|nr:hypothetical protein [Saliphagus infecundisoli]